AGKEVRRERWCGNPVENRTPQPPAPANHGIIRAVDGKATLGLLIAQPVGSRPRVVEQFAKRKVPRKALSHSSRKDQSECAWRPAARSVDHKCRHVRMTQHVFGRAAEPPFPPAPATISAHDQEV